MELVEPPAESEIGERVLLAGDQAALGEPASANQIKKKKIFQAVAADLRTNESAEAEFKGLRLTTSAGACAVKTIANGPIS